MTDSDLSEHTQKPAETASASPQEHMIGTAIRSANGKLYFIPDDALTTYEITDQEDMQALEHVYTELTHDRPSLKQAYNDLSTDLQPTVDARRVVTGIAFWIHNPSMK